MTFCRCPGGGRVNEDPPRACSHQSHSQNDEKAGYKPAFTASLRGGTRRQKMLDNNLIKMHQVLLGLFQEMMVLSLCGIGLPELYKELSMAAEGC